MAADHERLTQIACDAMNALGHCVSALEDIKKRGVWGGMQEVALKEVQAVYRPFFEVYEHVRLEPARERIAESTIELYEALRSYVTVKE